MTDPRSRLRAGSPHLYRASVHARRRIGSLRATNRRRRARRLLDGAEVRVDIAGAVGLGGLLSNAGWALKVGQAHGVDIALRFSSPTYMPTPAVFDWLPEYFTRSGAMYSPDQPYVEVGDLPRLQVSLSEAAACVWRYLSIRPDVVAGANGVRTGRYAAVHFRGSDKFLEAKPVQQGTLLARVEAEMASRGIDRLFVASDEMSFIAQARHRFGDEVVLTLQQDAVAVAGVPSHFSRVPGQVKAREALETMHALAGAEVCVRSASLLSAWAETLAAPDADFIEVVEP